MTLIRRIILALALMAGIAPVMAQAPSPVPALPDTERRTTYSITGTTCACAVNFALYGDSTDYGNWVEVWLNGTLIPSTNYTITSPSGSLATLPRPITNAVMTFNSVQTGTVQIVGARRPRRTSQFAENRGVAARDLNQAITDIVAMLRENWDKTNDVTGRAVLAPPGETLAVLASAASRASSGACFDASGNLVSCVSIPSTTFTAGNGIAITGVSPKTITNNIQGSGPITITGTNPLLIGCPTCNTSPAGNNTAIFVPSRAAASGTLDLHTYTIVKTGGYAVGGDGGGATFKNVGAATFIDTYITSASITAVGSGYTNGTYLGVPLGGSSTGLGCSGSVVVAGGVVTTVTTVIPCAGYKAGDVLTTSNAFIGGTGSGFAYTVNTVSTPVASFTDSVGTHFQYVVDAGNAGNVLQFGAKGDWNGTDGSATNNAIAFWSAAAWASFPVSTSNAQVNGSQVMVPKGAYMTCGAFNSSPYGIPIPQGVRFTGLGIGATTIVECLADGAGLHHIVLCDPLAMVGQYGCKIEQMTLVESQVTTSTANIAAIYSNSGQQFPLGEYLEIQPGKKSCIIYETGKGGAANDTWNHIDCEQAQGATNPAISLNASSTQHIIRSSVIGCNGTGCALGISHLNGRLIVDGLDMENFATGLQQNVSTAGNLSVYKNVQQNSNNCTQAIALVLGNTGGNIMFENVATTCPKTILNGQSGGTDFTGNIVKPIICPGSGACS
jgi:hypothetical protein